MPAKKTKPAKSRRNYEYDHHYGLGKKKRTQPVSARRRKKKASA